VADQYNLPVVRVRSVYPVELLPQQLCGIRKRIAARIIVEPFEALSTSYFVPRWRSRKIPKNKQADERVIPVAVPSLQLSLQKAAAAITRSNKRKKRCDYDKHSLAMSC
jgi:hypothetical protein